MNRLYPEKPLCVDLYAGLGGWSEAFLAEGYECIGYDIEAHRYPRTVSAQQDAVKRPGMNWSDRSKKGSKDAQFNRSPELDGSGEWMEYPGTLILRDVRGIHGRELKDAAVIVASPPCQKYSYMAMPWKRAKAQAAAIREDLTGKKLQALNELFNECFRIQREAITAAGHFIPLIIENVRGAQPWVGPANWNYGSFYLWGDVPALMPLTWKAQKRNPDGTAHGQGSWFAIADSQNRGSKGIPHRTSGHWTNLAESRRCICPTECDCANPEPETGVALCSNNCPIHNVHADPVDGCPAEMHKNHEAYMQDIGRKVSMNFHEHEKTGKPGRSFQSAAVAEAGLKEGGDWWNKECRKTGMERFGSKSNARKMASAMIAKIPFPLAVHIARTFKPATLEAIA